MDRLLRELCKSHSHCSPFIHPCSAAGLQLHDGETGRDRGGHGRRPLLAVKERLSGMTSPRLWIPDYHPILMRLVTLRVKLGTKLNMSQFLDLGVTGSNFCLGRIIKFGRDGGTSYLLTNLQLSL